MAAKKQPNKDGPDKPDKPDPNEINLDRAKAARTEQSRTPAVLRFGGKTFKLPIELPFSAMNALIAINRGEAATADEFYRELLDGQWDAFMALHPSVEDINELTDGVFKVYGITPGESSASTSS